MKLGNPKVQLRFQPHQTGSPRPGSQGTSHYLDSLERASLTEDEDLTPYRILMHRRLDATLGEYLSALQEALPQPNPTRSPKSTYAGRLMVRQVGQTDA